MTDQRENILHKAHELYLHYGVKSVSMDDICRELGMSKKTLYTYYAQKEELIEATLAMVRDMMDKKKDEWVNQTSSIWDVIGCISQMSSNVPDIRRIPPLVYDLKKYYPAIDKKHQQLVYEGNCRTMECILQRGIDEGVFLPQLDVATTASFFAKLHNLMIEESVKNNENEAIQKSIEVSAGILMRGIMTTDAIAKFDALKQTKN